METDLKYADKEWQVAFEIFMATTSVEIKRAIDGIQHYHEYQLVGKEDRKRRHIYDGKVTVPDLDENNDTEDDEEELYIEELAALNTSDTASQKKEHALKTIMHAKRVGIFTQPANGVVCGCSS